MNIVATTFISALFTFNITFLHAEEAETCGVTKVTLSSSDLEIDIKDLSTATVKRSKSNSTVTVVSSKISPEEARKSHHGNLEFSDHIILAINDSAIIVVNPNELCTIRAVLDDNKLSANVKDDLLDPESGNSLTTETTISPQ